MTSSATSSRPAAPGGTPRRRTGATSKDGRLALWLVLPTLLVLAAVIGYPVIRAIYRSLFSDPIGKDPQFIGLANYSRILGGDLSGDWWGSVRFTLFVTVVTVVIEVIIGMVMALVMNRAFRGRALVRASILVPWAIPTAVCAVLWRWTFSANGIVNELLGSQILWTGSHWPATWAIVFADVWKTAPFIGLLTLAGLQGIPDELYEAARVDGAGAWRRFRSITLPLVRPALVVAVLFRMLDVLRIYDLPAILTAGANDTTSMSILVVRQSITNLKAGLGSAMSTLTFVIIFVIALLYIRALGAKVMQGRAGEGS